MFIISVSSDQGLLSSLRGVNEGKEEKGNLLTRTHGGLLDRVGVGGLRELEKEVVHPDDTSVKMKRKIKPKGVESTRRSDRQLGEDIVIEKIEFEVKS